MKVLMIARKTLYTSPGGDTIQIVSTASNLRSLQIDVDVCIDVSNLEYGAYSLIHFFNIIRPDDILPHIKKSKIPYLISTIFVDYSEFDKRQGGFKGIVARVLGLDKMEYLKAVARILVNGDRINSKYYLINGHRKSVSLVAKNAALLLPNSHSEFARLKSQYNTEAPYKVVVNAIDENLFNKDVSPDTSFTDHILCVGRIEGRKNQLNLIKALMDTDLPLTIIGKPSPNHVDYYEQCLALVKTKKNMRILNHVNHEDLPSIFKSAKVHVLPSWFETTGLSSLEAGAMGCNVVISNKGDTYEYFKDLAYYCNPDDITSIKKAVIAAYVDERQSELQSLILNEYTWRKAALQTLSAYKSVLS